MVTLTFEGYVATKLIVTTYKNENIELENLFGMYSNDDYKEWLLECITKEEQLKSEVKLKAIEIYP